MNPGPWRWEAPHPLGVHLPGAPPDLPPPLQPLVCLPAHPPPADPAQPQRPIPRRIATFFRAYKPAFPRDLPGLGAPSPDTS